MKDPDEALRELSLEAAPESLNQRVRETLRAHRESPVWGRRPAWALAAACVAGILVLAVSRREPPPAPATPVCVVDAGPTFAAIFAPETESDDFFLRRKAQMNGTETWK